MSTETIATPPSVSWAQSRACVYLTFNVECDKPEINIKNELVSFKGMCAPEQKLNQVDIKLFSEVNPEKCTQVNKGRIIEVVLAKLKTDEPFWPSLTRDEKKHHWLKVDFNRWQDEDDSGDESDINSMIDIKNVDFDEEIEKDKSSSGEEDDLPDIE